MKNRIALSLPVLLFFAACVPSQSPAQQSSETVRKVVSQVAPQYPSLARSMNIRGSVRVEVSVAPNGTVKTLEVRGGHPVLVEAAERGAPVEVGACASRNPRDYRVAI
jgi:TonB-like protein